jgi:hypothetical protein
MICQRLIAYHILCGDQTWDDDAKPNLFKFSFNNSLDSPLREKEKRKVL